MTLRPALRSALLGTAVTFALAGSAFAEGCDKIVFSDVGWTDITATTAATSLVAQALGYETETKILSVPVTYTGLAEGDIDVFLGNWMPTMEADLAPYRDAGTVEVIRTNLEGAKYTLATNEAGAAAGITDFNNIKDHKDALEGKIYGIEPGNEGRGYVLRRIVRRAIYHARAIGLERDVTPRLHARIAELLSSGERVMVVAADAGRLPLARAAAPVQLGPQDPVVVVAWRMQQRGADLGPLHPQAHAWVQVAQHDAVADDLRARLEAVGEFDLDHAAGRDDDRPVGQCVRADRHQHHGIQGV